MRGNLIHQALCKLSRSITPEVQPLKEPEFHIRLATRLIASEQPIWRQQAIESGLGAVLADQVAEATRQGIERVAHSEVGRWCAMQWHADSQAEFALTLWERAGPLKLVIDRSFVTFDSRGDHTRWIIDYKTAQPDAATDSAAEQGTASSQTSADNDHWLHGELERHSAQLEGYGRALQAMHPDQRLRKALYFTATDALWELAPEGPVTHLQSAELRLPNGTRARLLRHPE